MKQFDVLITLLQFVLHIDSGSDEKQKYSYFGIKGKLSDSFTNYNYVGNTKVSVSIKKT